MIDERYRHLYLRALPYLNTRFNDIHTLVAYKQAKRLLACYPDADESVVLTAVVLHDVGWKMVLESEQPTAFGPNMSNPFLQRLHETEGARIAADILSELDFESAKLDEVVAIIDGHDTRAVPLSTNDRLVRDADRLWRFTPAGARIDAQRFGMKPVEHFAWLEAGIDSWLSTSEAKRLAHEYLAEARRHATR
ncbi:MAG: HD domain-containing protein [Burkholderiales bacterium]|nr:HD domain-containing protein [Burkholderiales bacterium]OJX09315.1 MAG: hypothetical protein BGO72_20565 [Burkholderiales bacterium 70-64]